MMRLADYLARIDYQGPVAPTLECLTAIHRQHLLHVPYENLDVQLGRKLDQDIERIFEKIVHRRRGGWCYEMNGLFGWALGEIGFDVMRMVGGVMRKSIGDETFGNHLVLAVRLDRTYIADVGLGNGLVEPVALEAERFEQGHRRFRLEPLGENVWRFHNFEGAMPSDFDFIHAPADEGVLSRKCVELQEDPESLFRQNLLCFRATNQGVLFLLGRLLMSYDKLESTRRLLASEEDLVSTMADAFGLEDIDAARLWPSVQARHEALFGAATAADISANPTEADS